MCEVVLYGVGCGLYDGLGGGEVWFVDVYVDDVVFC